MSFDRLNYTPDGVLIENEEIRFPSSLGKISLQHDLFIEDSMECKVGETTLVKGTDYDVADYDDAWGGYTRIELLNDSYLDDEATITYKAIGDYVEAEDVNKKLNKDGGTLKAYGETVKAHGSVSGTVTLNLNDGNVHSLTQTGNITIAFSNWPASGTNGSITLIAHHDSTERTWTWPASVVWPDAKPPDMNGTDTTTILTFTTIDGGTTVYGFVAGQNFGSGA